MKGFAIITLLLCYPLFAHKQGRGQDAPSQYQYYDPFQVTFDGTNLYLMGKKIAQVPHEHVPFLLAKLDFARKRGKRLKMKPSLLYRWQRPEEWQKMLPNHLASELGISSFGIFSPTTYEKSSFRKVKNRGCLGIKIQYFLNDIVLPTKKYPPAWVTLLDELLKDHSVVSLELYVEALFDPEQFGQLDAYVIMKKAQ